MTLDQLESIHAIVKAGSFRAAAEALNRSQPALSQSIKNLEEELGIQIFDRSEYRPKLTEAGAVFLSSSSAVLEAAHHAVRVGVELGRNKVETKLRVSADPLVPLEALEILAHECSRPTVPVTLIIDKTILKGAADELSSGRVDLAIGSCPKDRQTIEKIDIETVSLVGAISRKLLQEKNRATAAFLKMTPQILVYDKNFDDPPDSLMPNAIIDGGGPKIFVPDHFTKLRLIQGGLGWGRISKQEFDAGEDLVAIDKSICEPVQLELCVMRPKHRPIGPIARVIWDVFKKRHEKSGSNKKSR